VFERSPTLKIRTAQKNEVRMGTVSPTNEAPVAINYIIVPIVRIINGLLMLDDVIEIEAPEHTGATNAFFTNIPNRVFSVIARGPCTLVPEPNSTFSLLGPDGETLGQFKAAFSTVVRENSSFEAILKEKTPTRYAPILPHFRELSFRTEHTSINLIPRKPKKKVVSIDQARTGTFPRWNPARTFQSLEKLRERFNTSHNEIVRLLRELRAMLDAGRDVDQATLASVFEDVRAFRKDEQDCIDMAKKLHNCLPDRTA
jgi:hypothetical protein